MWNYIPIWHSVLSNIFLISFCYSAFYNVYCPFADVGVARVDYASFILSKHRKADWKHSQFAADYQKSSWRDSKCVLIRRCKQTFTNSFFFLSLYYCSLLVCNVAIFLYSPLTWQSWESTSPFRTQMRWSICLSGKYTCFPFLKSFPTVHKWKVHSTVNTSSLFPS